MHRQPLSEVRIEVPLELEHVAQVIRGGEAKAPIHLGRHIVVPDLLPQGPG
jgi:hypothetical protein